MPKQKSESPEDIVRAADEAHANSQPCPYCQMYHGHQVNCPYLTAWGQVQTKPADAEGMTEVQRNELLDKMKPSETSKTDNLSTD